jgi:hypothetical protein
MIHVSEKLLGNGSYWPRGALLGLATGDALGTTWNSSRRARSGESLTWWAAARLTRPCPAAEMTSRQPRRSETLTTKRRYRDFSKTLRHKLGRNRALNNRGDRGDQEFLSDNELHPGGRKPSGYGAENQEVCLTFRPRFKRILLDSTRRLPEYVAQNRPISDREANIRFTCTVRRKSTCGPNQTNFSGG